MVTNRVDINNLLEQMRDMKAQAGMNTNNPAIKPRSDVEAAMRPGSDMAVGGPSSAPAFSDMFSDAINAVNDTQKTSGALAKAYERGDTGVTLTQVMVASEKSSVSFKALTEVRNKLVEAYQDVMNMSI